MKRAEIISDSFHCGEVVYNDARCVRDIDRYTYRVRIADIYNVKRESGSLAYLRHNATSHIVRRDGFHSENDVTAADTSFTQAPIKCYQSAAEIHVILLKSQWRWNIYALHCFTFRINYDKYDVCKKISAITIIFFFKWRFAFFRHPRAYTMSKFLKLPKVSIVQGIYKVSWFEVL